MDKEKAKKKASYHNKRAKFYEVKVKEAKERENQIGFKIPNAN